MTKRPYTKSSMQNGAQVFFIATHDSPVVNIKISFPCGFLRFAKDKHHLPHVLEHMLLNVSERFRFENNLNRYLQRLGAYANATTSPDELSVTLRVPTSSVVEAFNAVWDSIFTASPNEELLEREKSVVIREIHELFDSVSAQISAGLMARIMPEYFSGDLDEHVASVEAVTLVELTKTHTTYIVPNECKVMISGSVTESQKKELSRIIDSTPVATEVHSNEPMPQLTLARDRIGEFHGGLEDNGVLVLNFTEELDPDETVESKSAKNILDIYLFNSSAAIIPAELRSAGLIYSWDTSVVRLGNISTYTVSLTADSEDLPQIITIILRNILRVVNGGVTAEEIADMRAYTSYLLPTLLETTEEYLEWYETDIRYDRSPRTVKSELEVAATITSEQLVSAAKEVFLRGGIYAVAVGDVVSVEWSRALQGLLDSVGRDSKHGSHEAEKLFTKFLGTIDAEPAEDYEERHTILWLVYGLAVFVSAIMAIWVSYVPVIGQPDTTASLLKIMYDQGQWLWGALVFLPMFIGLIVEFNLSAYIKRHRTIFVLLTFISAMAYIYGVFAYFGDTGKDNAPFSPEGLASIVHAVTFLLLTPIAVFAVLRMELVQLRTRRRQVLSQKAKTQIS